MTTLFEAAKLLGVPAKDKPLASAAQYLRQLDRGLPVRSLDRIAAAIAPADAKFRHRIVPRATLARLRSRGRLNKAQSELVTRLAEVWTDALRVWKSAEAARAFLDRRHPMLGNQRPVDIALQSAVGAELVRDVLGRLEHGSAV